MTLYSLMRMIVASTVGLVFAGGLSPAHGIEEVAKLTPSDAPDGGLGFGRAVAISGDFIVVGAPIDEPPDVFGSAYVFHRVNGSWVEQTKLTASTQFWEDVFGTSVAIDGDTIVVGAPGTMDSSWSDARAYVYRYDGFAWSEEAELIPSGSFDGDRFGISVSISGDLIAVGAPGLEFSPSQVYVFRRDVTTWSEEAILVGADTDYDDAFGQAVSADGGLVVVGAYHDDHAGDTSGSAYVFRFDGENWGQDAKLTASDAGPEQAFGTAVGLSDGVVLVAGVHSTLVGAGGVYVYERQNGSWVEAARLEATDAAFNDAFGASLDIDAETVVVGAIGDDDAGSLSGSAYLFKRIGTDWLQVAKYVASDAASGRLFGFSTGVDGDTAVVGGGGAAYVFNTNIEIPTASSWGLTVLALTLALAGALILHRRQRRAVALRAQGPRGRGRLGSARG